MMTRLLTPHKQSRLRHRCRWRFVICGAILLGGGTSHAADGVDGRPRDPAAEQANQNIEGLLQKLEQQILSGHTMAPAGNCAVDTWVQVLQTIPTDSPRVKEALASFVTNARGRADQELSAGNMIAGGDLSVFADQANELLVGSSKTARPGIAKGPPGDAAVTFEHLAASLPPVPASDAAQARHPSNSPGNIPGVQTASAAAAQPQNAVQALVAEYYAARGDQLLAARDVSEARKYYEYAVNAGSARAAATLAKTYDAGVVAQSGVVPEVRHHNQDNSRGHRGHVLRTRTQGPIARDAAEADTYVR
jgi:hypothetical protein